MAVVKRLSSANLSRHDLLLISDWVAEGSRVIDLGCGNGHLLSHLQANKRVTGYGIEKNPELIAECISNGVNVIQTNLDRGLHHFDDDSFDVVILSLTLQAMRYPEQLLREMLRISGQAIVTFPNFGYWRNRTQVALTGKMPISPSLPEKWFDTPNIHLCTIRDFAELCQQLGLKIDAAIAVHHQHGQGLAQRLMPNLFGEIALCRISKQHEQ